MANPCLENQCIKCCQDTMMILSSDDIKRIEQCGFQKKDFVVKKKECYQLKNKNHRCVFHDGTKCKIYSYRPIGCQLYPIIYDMDTKKAIWDLECPYHTLFELSKIKEQMLFDVVNKVLHKE